MRLFELSLESFNLNLKLMDILVVLSDFGLEFIDGGVFPLNFDFEFPISVVEFVQFISFVSEDKVESFDFLSDQVKPAFILLDGDLELTIFLVVIHLIFQFVLHLLDPVLQFFDLSIFGIVAVFQSFVVELQSTDLTIEFHYQLSFLSLKGNPAGI